MPFLTVTVIHMDLNITGYIYASGGTSSASGGGGGLISIVYSSGYVIGEQTSYGGSGAIENGAAGITYIKNGEFIKKVRCKDFMIDICLDMVWRKT